MFLLDVCVCDVMTPCLKMLLQLSWGGGNLPLFVNVGRHRGRLSAVFLLDVCVTL